ncbi:lantibiotic dehydratase [Streptomyces sp. M10(2022)]
MPWTSSGRGRRAARRGDRPQPYRAARPGGPGPAAQGAVAGLTDAGHPARHVSARRDGPPDKRQRKIERSLLSYLYRTVCKTSPFSTFTGVAPGFLSGDGALRIEVDDAWAGQVRLNVVALGRLVEAVIADPVRRADLPVSLASGWGLDDDRVRYVRRWITEGDDDTAVTFDAVKDRLFFLRRSGTLERLLGLFEERPRCVTANSPTGSPGTVGPPRRSARTICGRCSTSAWCRCRACGPRCTTPTRCAPSRARCGPEGPWADRLADRLEAPVSCVDSFADASPKERRELLAQLRTGLRAVQEEELGAVRAKVPQTLLYEDTAAGPGVRLDPAAWQELAAGPLASVERILPAFDLTLPQRITFQGSSSPDTGRAGAATTCSSSCTTSTRTSSTST